MSSAARNAPTVWAPQYGSTLPHGNPRRTASASVTAGLMCAPEMPPATYTPMTTPMPHAQWIDCAPAVNGVRTVCATTPTPNTMRLKVPSISAESSPSRVLRFMASARLLACGSFDDAERCLAALGTEGSGVSRVCSDPGIAISCVRMIAPGASMAGQAAGRLEGDMRELGMTPEVRELRERVRVFMEEYVYPGEPVLDREDDEAEALLKDLQARVKAAGMWAPFIGPEAGGTGRGFLPYAYLNEVIGRSFWAPLIFGCQAPDTGNAEVLHLFGTPEQKDQWLKPLVAGEIRSFFSMTEPEVSGSDPTQLRTTAVRDGDDWVINGHKWFSTGAEGAAFAIVMAVTEPDAPPHRRMSQIIVPAGTPGLEIGRAVPVLGHRGRGWSTHCEVRYRG